MKFSFLRPIAFFLIFIFSFQQVTSAFPTVSALPGPQMTEKLRSLNSPTGPAKKIIVKAGNVGKTLVTVPIDAVRETTETAIDTTIGETARQMGVTEPESPPEEKTVEPQKKPKVI